MGDTNQQAIFVSAPGKIILFGEHAVVYGRTAIAGSIDLRTYVSLYSSADGRIYLSLPDLGVEKTWLLKDLQKAAEKLADVIPEDGAPPSLDLMLPIIRKLSGACEGQCGVQHLAILAFWYLLLGVAQRKRDMLAVKVTVRFKLPSSVGLGSSGAFCVGTTAALMLAADLIPRASARGSIVDGADTATWAEPHLDLIRRWASQAESIIHGRASGLDAAICTYGGVASFKPGTKINHIANLADLRVILINSKIERNTSCMVAAVKDRLRKFPHVLEGIFNAVEAISLDAIRVLNQEEPIVGNNVEHSGSTTNSRSSSVSEADGDVAGGAGGSIGDSVSSFNRLNELCRMNNQLLVALGVGHPKVDLIATTLARYGIHPKMTGAGGGGSLYAFLKPDTSNTVMQMIENEMNQLGFDVYQPALGGGGVSLHATRPEMLALPVNAAP